MVDQLICWYDEHDVFITYLVFLIFIISNICLNSQVWVKVAFFCVSRMDPSPPVSLPLLGSYPLISWLSTVFIFIFLVFFINFLYFKHKEKFGNVIEVNPPTPLCGTTLGMLLQTCNRSETSQWYRISYLIAWENLLKLNVNQKKVQWRGLQQDWEF